MSTSQHLQSYIQDTQACAGKTGLINLPCTIAVSYSKEEQRMRGWHLCRAIQLEQYACLTSEQKLLELELQQALLLVGCTRISPGGPHKLCYIITWRGATYRKVKWRSQPILTNLRKVSQLLLIPIAMFLTTPTHVRFALSLAVYISSGCKASQLTASTRAAHQMQRN